MMTRWLLSVIAVILPSIVRAAPPCRCLSFQPCWPSTSDFQQLSSQVSQPLIHPTPPASACYPPFKPSDGNCLDVQSHLNNGPWRSNLPGAMQAINFETFTFENGTIDACYYNVLLGVPCHQGNIPVIGVDARTVADVQATLSFASKHYLRLVIKNTGHDFLSRSMARGAFMLWTHNFKDIAYDDAFTPSGAPSNSQTYKALTLGAGVQWYEAYKAANDHGRAIVGGSSLSVGAAGGWIQGGGHSALAPIYGLGVDNAIQFTVVLSSGEFVTTNEHQYQDLFWALRGGGGGTYGVVISVTYRTHEVLPTTAITLAVAFLTPAIAQNVTTELIAIQPTLQDAGWGGYSYLSNTGITSVTFVSNNSLAQGEATWSSFIDRVQAAAGPVMVRKQSFPSFYEAALPYFNGDGLIGVPSEFISRFLSRGAAQKQPENVAKAALAIAGRSMLLSVAGGAVSEVKPDSAGLNPAWREALGVIESYITWHEGATTAEIDHLRQMAAAGLATLDTVSPDSGTYFNEASLYEKDFAQSFFGSHYPRLKEIKRKYDPIDLFLVAEGVGSDEWDKSLNCRLG